MKGIDTLAFRAYHNTFLATRLSSVGTLFEIMVVDVAAGVGIVADAVNRRRGRFERLTSPTFWSSQTLPLQQLGGVDGLL